MRINLASVLVDDQDKALEFYTEVLGFVKKTDLPLGEARWLTVVCTRSSRSRAARGPPRVREGVRSATTASSRGVSFRPQWCLSKHKPEPTKIQFQRSTGTTRAPALR
jgi:catechol 2,3-dioxygenase-like lactoylglutathione lyase family enzyme